MENLKNTLKIISFDVDGTLVDMEYNDLVWFKGIPELVAKKKKIHFNESVRLVKEEYSKLGEQNLKWYDIKYWIEHFALDIPYENILKKYESKIRIYSDVIPVLEQLQKHFLLIITTAMPREFLAPKMINLQKYFKFNFSAISDFKELKNSEIYLKICQILNVSPTRVLHIGDHWEFDYIEASKAGLNAIFLDRSNNKKGEFIVNNLKEIESIIKNNYNNMNEYKP